MQNVSKYTRQYFCPPVPCMDWAKKDHIEKALLLVYDCIWIMFYFCAAIQAVKGGDCHDLQRGRASGYALYQWQYNR